MKESFLMDIRKALAFGATVFVLSLTLSLSVLAQDNKDNNNKGRRNQQQQQQQQQQQAPAQQNVGPIAQSKDEYDAFMAVQNEQTPAKKIELAEGFIARYPASDFVMYAQTFRVASYGQVGKPKEAVAAAEQAIDATVKLGEKVAAKADADSKLSDKDKEAIRKKDKNAVFFDKSSPQFTAFMSQSEQRILALYQTIISGYQQLNDAAKMMEWGDK